MNQLHNSYKTYTCKTLIPPIEHMMLGDVTYIMERAKVQYLKGFLEMLLELLFITFSL